MALTGEEDSSGARENHGDRPTADALALRAVKTFVGKRWAGKTEPDEKPAEEQFGTMAYRMELHRERAREREREWS